MSFVSPEILSKLSSLTKTDADDANFGIVKVDSNGRILLYNKYESELAGVPSSSAEGKNFFTELAPCTNNKLFFGKFKSGVEIGELNSLFNYTFTYKMKPTNVAIHLLHDKNTKTNWVFVQKRIV
ncbi:MAG: photoactive yellow protein [Bacteriovorax sp.]|nr:photoactive yellow protein [Bacteriovorax sp.]